MAPNDSMLDAAPRGPLQPDEAAARLITLIERFLRESGGRRAE
jgi:hypothetical protein